MHSYILSNFIFGYFTMNDNLQQFSLWDRVLWSGNATISVYIEQSNSIENCCRYRFEKCVVVARIRTKRATEELQRSDELWKIKRYAEFNLRGEFNLNFSDYKSFFRMTSTAILNRSRKSYIAPRKIRYQFFCVHDSHVRHCILTSVIGFYSAIRIFIRRKPWKWFKSKKAVLVGY